MVACPGTTPEGCGRIPLEAALASRPVVAAALGGYLETVAHGETGVLVEPGNRAALVDGIAGLLNDPEYASRLGREARRRVLERFTPERSAAELLDVWRKIAPLPGAEPRE